MKNGEFKENLGIRVREERIAREKARQKRVERSAPAPTVNAQELRERIAACEGPLAEMRKSLGMPCRHVSEDDIDGSQ